MLAALGYGFWSLVWGALTQSVFSAAGNLASTPPDVRPLFGRRELKELLNFGVGMSLSTWVNYLARNGDNFIVGRSLGTQTLGLYSRAYALMNLPFTHVAAVMSAVLFPALSQLQDDRTRLRRAFLLMTRLTAAASAPVMAAMAVAAPHFISSVYGPRWIGTIVPLQILCVFGYFRALYHIGGIVAQSAGRVYDDFRNQVIYAGLVVAAALVGVPFSIAGVALGVGVAIFVMFLATGRLALDATNTSWQVYFGQQIAPVVAGLATCGIAFAARTMLEARGAASATITVAIAGASAVPAVLGVLWVLCEPGFQPLLKNLPRFVRRSVDPMHRLRRRVDLFAPVDDPKGGGK